MYVCIGFLSIKINIFKSNRYHINIRTYTANYLNSNSLFERTFTITMVMVMFFDSLSKVISLLSINICQQPLPCRVVASHRQRP